MASKNEMPDRINASPRNRTPAVSGFSVSKFACRRTVNSVRSDATFAWATPRPMAVAMAMTPIASMGSHIQLAMVWMSVWRGPVEL